MPGVSRKTICPSGLVTIPLTTCRVVWGLSVTIEIFSPTRRLRSVDFPEFGRPTIEANPDFIMLASGPPASRRWYTAFGGLLELALAGPPTRLLASRPRSNWSFAWERGFLDADAGLYGDRHRSLRFQHHHVRFSLQVM